jgi:DNA-binding SARP family transcriptional activator
VPGPLTVRLLGRPEIRLDGGPAPAEVLWRKNLALLAYLLRSPRGTRPREHLAALLWGDRPEAAARHSLNEALRVLRRTLGSDAVATIGDHVALADGCAALDTDELEAAVEGGRPADAAALVRGEFLEGLSVAGAPAFEDWLAAERSWWQARCLSALAATARRAADAGDLDLAATVGHRATTIWPDAAAAAAILMEALALRGERAEALAVWEAWKARGHAVPADLAALAGRVRSMPAAPALGPQAAERARSRRLPLVERGEALGRLLDAWRTAREAQRAALLVVLGDPGTGKTRLAGEFATRTAVDGATVIRLRAVEADRDLPGEGLRALVASGLHEAPGVAGAAPAALATLTRQGVQWAERFPAARDAAAGISLPQALAEVVRAAADARPLLLVVDDAHHLDEASALALDRLLRDTETAPVGLLLAASPANLRPGVEGLHHRAAGTGAVVRLGPLSAAAIASLADAALPGLAPEARDRLARRVAHDSAGLPVLAVELLHAVAQGLALDDHRAAWPRPLATLTDTMPGDLPDAVLSAIRVGFRRLSRPAQAVLAACASLDDRVAAATLLRAAGLDPEAGHVALDELEWGRWLEADPRGWRFAARIVRDVVAQDLVTPGQRLRFREAAGLTGA